LGSGGGAEHRNQVDAVQHAVSLVVRSLRQARLREYVGEQANTRLTAPQYTLLPLIARSGGTRVSDLASDLRVEVPTVSRQLQVLERQGLIERSSVAEDRRVALISLTDAGRAMYTSIHESWVDTIDTVLKGWSPDDVHALADLFLRFATDLYEFAQPEDRNAPPAPARARRSPAAADEAGVHESP
jgi:DNA-binding MarR family transcriptional regulator